MVTNYPQQLAAAAEITYERTSTVVARAMGRLGQLMCGAKGHDAVLHFEGKRVMMRCTSCGHDTPGWEVNDRAPRKRFEGDARRHQLKPQIVLRKTA
jgi:NAD-dependent SIR2 family protein deacetylase